MNFHLRGESSEFVIRISSRRAVAPSQRVGSHHSAFGFAKPLLRGPAFHQSIIRNSPHPTICDHMRPYTTFKPTVSGTGFRPVRYALNFRNESQLVLGLGAPIGLNRAAQEVDLFFYFSFEHRVLGKGKD